MRQRITTVRRLGFIAVAAAVLAAAPLAAQTLPRTEWGKPDLRGVWDYNTLKPLERPSEVEGREFLTEEERPALLPAHLNRRPVPLHRA